MGFDALREAIQPETFSASVPRLYGLLLALALLDETLLDFFRSSAQSESLDEYVPSDLDLHVNMKLVNSIDLRQPRALIVLFDLCSSLPPPQRISYLVFKTIDRIAGAAHRNQALMNEAGLMTPIFSVLYGSPSHILPEPSRHLLRKTLRRMLDIGFCSSTEARVFLQKAVHGTTVNTDVLGIIKSGTKSRWPEFVSFHHGGSLVFSDDSGKTFPPPSGFTFLVSLANVCQPERWVTNLSPGLGLHRISPIVLSDTLWRKICIAVTMDCKIEYSSQR